MTKQEIKKATNELYQNYFIFNKSVDFIYQNIENVLKEIEILENTRWNEKKYKILIKKLEHLLKKSNVEKQIADKYIKKVKNLIKIRDKK